MTFGGRGCFHFVILLRKSPLPYVHHSTSNLLLVQQTTRHCLNDRLGNQHQIGFIQQPPTQELQGLVKIPSGSCGNFTVVNATVTTIQQLLWHWLQIRLITANYHRNLKVTYIVHLAEPLHHARRRGFGAQVEHHDGALGMEIVSILETTMPGIAGHVPKLQGHRLVVRLQQDRVDEETPGGHMLLSELSGGMATQERGLAYARITQQQALVRLISGPAGTKFH
ncbi:hypothetical protein M5D96_002626 [Drosophila gunungcola]|uniref:Uncharacterized protein n=1 Tax=Drosophila gunungcola TaxID=103775 RepID=A0A9P9Z0C9_9MUSC|nr:hypothetical protein M5D96_002626 [Drosophila gunungcola]